MSPLLLMLLVSLITPAEAGSRRRARKALKALESPRPSYWRCEPPHPLDGVVLAEAGVGMVGIAPVAAAGLSFRPDPTHAIGGQAQLDPWARTLTLAARSDWQPVEGERYKQWGLMAAPMLTLSTSGVEGAGVSWGVSTIILHRYHWGVLADATVTQTTPLDRWEPEWSPGLSVRVGRTVGHIYQPPLMDF